MNRFKFRVWDNDLKKFLNSSVRNLEFLKTYLEIIDQSDFGAASFFIQETALIPQQYTGLKDKNGKEIYEGDIVKYARTKVESIEVAKGCFYSKAIEIGEEIGEILFIKPSFCLSFDHIRYDDIMPMCLAEHRYEVIGNIFENPELIKNK